MPAPKLTQLAHERWEKLLKPGDLAIDATVGNGHDTAALAALVGPTGWVHGFDIQAVALERARVVLAGHTNVSLHHASHEVMLQHVPAEHYGRVQLVVFNLGYLPHGDPSQTTQAESTRVALGASATLLAPGGWISVLAYRGHPGGEAERSAVQDLFTEWNWPTELRDSGSPQRPGPTWLLTRK